MQASEQAVGRTRSAKARLDRARRPTASKPASRPGLPVLLGPPPESTLRMPATLGGGTSPTGCWLDVSPAWLRTTGLGLRASSTLCSARAPMRAASSPSRVARAGHTKAAHARDRPRLLRNVAAEWASLRSLSFSIRDLTLQRCLVTIPAHK